ncbi:DUF3108 domain-containing protein [Jannaschia seohaensis]|uniref:Uncharacterized protein DUF3108 n=1 Tax=Jannaschia seohaensis TaxID=475081 RepID=A0A2Y9C304_9RHOB|nr:DUF3108 domain-containing protein [Jannaschia seohaensis]PWJ13306.1 uncharacterized protein DUF3108 [Jannaschia seohaensis]SSA50632.1 Protein of unknown function [Jannaschia seohaensis]
MMARSLLCAALLAAAPAFGQGMDATYDLSLLGITGGTIALRGRDQGDSYSISSAAKATGMVGSLLKYGYEGRAQGRIQGGRHISSEYVEIEFDDGERTSSVTLFDGTTPASVTFDPPREPKTYDIDPQAQSDVIDPLTALYLVLRPTAPGAACNTQFDTFDGRHVARLTLGPAQAAENGTLTCEGEYLRLRGYSAKDLERQPNALMTFTLTPVDDGKVQVSEITSRTRLGVAVLRRR